MADDDFWEMGQSEDEEVNNESKNSELDSIKQGVEAAQKKNRELNEKYPEVKSNESKNEKTISDVEGNKLNGVVESHDMKEKESDVVEDENVNSNSSDKQQKPKEVTKNQDEEEIEKGPKNKKTSETSDKKEEKKKKTKEDIKNEMKSRKMPEASKDLTLKFFKLVGKEALKTKKIAFADSIPDHIPIAWNSTKKEYAIVVQYIVEIASENKAKHSVFVTELMKTEKFRKENLLVSFQNKVRRSLPVELCLDFLNDDRSKVTKKIVLNEDIYKFLVSNLEGIAKIQKPIQERQKNETDQQYSKRVNEFKEFQNAFSKRFSDGPLPENDDNKLRSLKGPEAPRKKKGSNRSNNGETTTRKRKEKESNSVEQEDEDEKPKKKIKSKHTNGEESKSKNVKDSVEEEDENESDSEIEEAILTTNNKKRKHSKKFKHIELNIDEDDEDDDISEDNDPSNDEKYTNEILPAHLKLIEAYWKIIDKDDKRVFIIAMKNCLSKTTKTVFDKIA